MGHAQPGHTPTSPEGFLTPSTRLFMSRFAACLQLCGLSVVAVAAFLEWGLVPGAAVLSLCVVVAAAAWEASL